MYNAPKVILAYFIHFLKDNNDHGGKNWRCFLRSLKTYLSDVIEKEKNKHLFSILLYMTESWWKRKAAQDAQSQFSQSPCSPDV